LRICSHCPPQTLPQRGIACLHSLARVTVAGPSACQTCKDTMLSPNTNSDLELRNGLLRLGRDAGCFLLRCHRNEDVLCLLWPCALLFRLSAFLGACLFAEFSVACLLQNVSSLQVLCSRLLVSPWQNCKETLFLPSREVS